jgi:hypothetical protein
VTGVDVGFKYVGGKPTTDVAIRLFVRKKLVKVTPGERFPGLVGQHKTDVIELWGGILPDFKYVTLTALPELQTPTPIGWKGKIWNQSVSGSSKGGPWTITNIYQTLTLRAKASGFTQPVFRWWINSAMVSDFNTNVSENVIVTAAVRMDTPQNAPLHPTTTKLERIELQVNAQGIPAPANTAVLKINPILAQGHIPIMVWVEVCESVETGKFISLAATTATLDTQVLTSP